jgi:hypothetical protein
VLIVVGESSSERIFIISDQISLREFIFSPSNGQN